MKERNGRLEEENDEVTQQDADLSRIVDTSYVSASAHASHNTSIATDTQNTSALTPRSAMDADAKAQANARTPLRNAHAYASAGDASDADTSINITQSPHKQLANELLRKNAETKEALRAKTSKILQELSITKQFVCYAFLYIFYLFLIKTNLSVVSKQDGKSVIQSYKTK